MTMMKIAIHKREGSFSDRWIAYCESNGISYKLVNCYDYDILDQLSDCNGLMWNWGLNDYKAMLFARQLTLSIKKTGFKMFPDVDTSWHYDDKVGQKYLLEAIKAPLIKSFIFYSEKDALNWIDTTSFPKVFKLRGGASSVNVKLLRSKNQARKFAKKAFGKGFHSIDKWSRLNERWRVFKKDRDLMALRGVISGLARLFIPLELERFSSKEKGYFYVQDFVPNNNFDSRIVVIGARCYALRRYCRPGDFRASGSRIMEYEKEKFDIKMIKTSFEVAKKLGSQSLALDFVWDGEVHKIIEISYTFTMRESYDDYPGYWDDKLNWHVKEVNPQIFMIEDFIETL